MHKNMPNDDSVMLSEGIVEDDTKIILLNRAFDALITGELLKEEEQREEEQCR